MDFFIFIILLLRATKVFTGFTFTDAEDFTPLLTLFIGLICVASIGLSAQKKASFPLIASMLLLSLGPILPNIGLYFLAREHQAICGNWPQVMIDDPKNALGHVSPQFDSLFHLVNYLEAFSGAWMVIFVALFFVAKPQFSTKQRRLFISLTVFSLFLVVLDPGNLYAWWMD